MRAGLLPARAADAVELMDLPDCDLDALNRTYAQFRLVNAAVSAWRTIYTRELRAQLASSGRTCSLLDIGSGGGDIARSLARWARRDGLRLHVTAADPDPRAHRFASAEPASGVTYRQAASGELVEAGERFDVVVSNHLLHHLDGAGLLQLLQDSEELCRIKAVHNDIERSTAAYLLYSAGTLPLLRSRSFLRPDGLTSIRRSYTQEELSAVVPASWTVQRQAPFRNLLIHVPATAR